MQLVGGEGKFCPICVKIYPIRPEDSQGSVSLRLVAGIAGFVIARRKNDMTLVA